MGSRPTVVPKCFLPPVDDDQSGDDGGNNADDDDDDEDDADEADANTPLRTEQDESFRPSRLKILIRGDFIGALNCMFPDLQLPADRTGRMPVLDQTFSLFSESPQNLRHIFSSAREYRAEVATDFRSRKQRLQRTVAKLLPAQSPPAAINSAATGEMETPQKTTPIAGAKPPETQPVFSLLRTARNPTAARHPPLDTDYVRFVDEQLPTAQCPAKCADFKSVESLITYLDRTGDERLRTKQIAPFNSNLPVLNISECGDLAALPAKAVASSASSSAAAARNKPAHSALPKPPINPVLPKDQQRVGSCPSGSSAMNKKVASKSEAKDTGIARKASRKQSRGGRGRGQRLKPSATIVGIDPSGEAPNPSKLNVSSAATTSQSHSVAVSPAANAPRKVPTEQSPDVEQRISRLLQAVLHSSDDSIGSCASVAESEEPTITPEVRCPTPEPDRSSALSPDQHHLRTTSSREIFLHNLRQLQQAVIRTTSRQRRLEAERRQLTTLYLRDQVQAATTRTSRTSASRPASAKVAAGHAAKTEDWKQKEQQPIASGSDLELQALQQYRTSDESMEEKFNRLEREAQEQYPY